MDRAKKAVQLKSGETSTIQFDLSKQSFWYDFRISCKDDNTFQEQYAGRIETGESGKSDPLLSR